MRPAGIMKYLLCAGDLLVSLGCTPFHGSEGCCADLLCSGQGERGCPCDSSKERAPIVSQVPGEKLYIFQAGALASAKALRQEFPGVYKEQIESWCG